MTKTCEVCGAPIVYNRLRHTRWFQTRFCSKTCSGQSRRTVPDRTCQYCGKTFRPRLAVKRFCSKECYNGWRLVSPVTRNERVRGRARARMWYAPRPCEVCSATSRPDRKGAASMIQRHHRDGDQMNNDPSNIAFLCQPDHTEEHRRMRALGIGRKVGGPRPRIVALFRAQGVERAAIARGLRAQGLTNAQIAEQMGYDRASVYRWFKKYPEAALRAPTFGTVDVKVSVIR